MNRARPPLRDRPRFPLFLAAAVTVLDQLTKYVVRASMALHESRPVFGDFLTLRHGRNEGIAFGLLSDAPLPSQRVLLSAFTLAATVVILVFLRQMPARPRGPRLALALVLGGAMGNLVERVRLGYVTDFVHVSWRGHDWYDFNLADSAISVGSVLLVLHSLRPARRAGVVEQRE